MGVVAVVEAASGGGAVAEAALEGERAPSEVRERKGRRGEAAGESSK